MKYLSRVLIYTFLKIIIPKDVMVLRNAFFNIITILVRVNMMLAIKQYLKIEVKHYIFVHLPRG